MMGSGPYSPSFQTPAEPVIWNPASGCGDAEAGFQLAPPCLLRKHSGLAGMTGQSHGVRTLVCNQLNPLEPATTFAYMWA